MDSPHINIVAQNDILLRQILSQVTALTTSMQLAETNISSLKEEMSSKLEINQAKIEPLDQPINKSMDDNSDKAELSSSSGSIRSSESEISEDYDNRDNRFDYLKIKTPAGFSNILKPSQT